MSRLSVGLPGDSSAPAAIIDVAATTAIAFAITYLTDDPGYTADGSLLSDGDALTMSGSVAEELVFFSTAVLADIALIRTAVNDLIAASRDSGQIQT